MIFDLHCDTLSELYKIREKGESARLCDAGLSVSEQRLRAADYAAQCFALWVTEKYSDPYSAAMAMADIFDEEVKNSNILAPVRNYSEILKNRSEGKISALLTMEDAAPIGSDMQNLYRFYERGVRMIALLWNYPNAVGYPNIDQNAPRCPQKSFTPNTRDGLTDFGIELVSEMNRLGVIIDVSHLSDAGFYDVAKYSKKPFVASHSNSRAICPHVRNLTDEMLKMIANSGGVVGMNYYGAFVSADGGELVRRLVGHIKHIADVIGYDHIALGSDFDGIPRGDELDSPDDVKKLTDALFSSGLSSTEIEKITSENALRVFRDCI